MELKMIDIGVNLMHRQFEEDRRAVEDRAFASGVSAIIITGTGVGESKKAARYAAQRPKQLFATAGVHPHGAKSCNEFTIGQLEELALLPQVIAIGECGLDYDRDFSPREVQRKWFKEQIDLARKLKMPLFLHERSAFKDFREILQKNKDVCNRAVIHCFTGTEAELKAYLDLGCYIGITGWICDERRGVHLRTLVKHIPKDRLMIETDAPFLIPRNMERKPMDRRNESAFLGHIAREIGNCMGLTMEQIAELSTENAKKFFGI